MDRATYNAGGGCWQLPGAGGQSSRGLDPERPRFGHEINLFCGRSRSMLVLLWEPLDGNWRLQRVGAVGFRCLNSTDCWRRCTGGVASDKCSGRKRG